MNYLLPIPMALLLYFGSFMAFMALLGVMGVRNLRKRERVAISESSTHSFGIIIPAHNESTLIERCLESVLQLDYDRNLYDILVLADNCDDDTVELASKHPVEVLTRTNSEFRGKGYAIYEALTHLLGDQDKLHDAYVIIDADTVVDDQLLRVFGRGLADGKVWMQAMNRGLNVGDSWRCEALDLAMTLINGVWLAGLNAMRVSCSLRGNGMCLARSGVQKFPWSQSGLVEDLEYSWNLKLAGEMIYFEPQAQVLAEMVSDGGSRAVSQRTRWESGRKSIKKRYFSKLMRSPLSIFSKLVLLMDLFMLPLSRLLVSFMGSCLLFALVLYLGLGGGIALMAFSVGTLVGLALMVSYVMCPFILKMVPIRRVFCLLYVPQYFLWKCKLYFYHKPQEWVRTPRS